MIYWKLFLSFLITNLLGYGGGPATIPLIQTEVVTQKHWLTQQEFHEAFAMGNALPGPIATKMAGYIGYKIGGVFGSFIAVFATVVPSLLLMIFLIGLLHKNRDSIRVKRMTSYVKPTIVVLLGLLTYESFSNSFQDIGALQVIFIAVCTFFIMGKLKIHPALVVLGALIYGAINL
ncbi:chromate transporter [Bacillus sp. AFS041924]|uniref:chromate transporter n=1 Tax=Bacillus sp. AFS041924 TaxID=2033503 RepID=UPI000BFB71C5|nr:chromate transporter [Bacillus sp. AFS041924]PGS49564.1 transporter [Bacillus sp. AFS041924]